MGRYNNSCHSTSQNWSAYFEGAHQEGHHCHASGIGNGENQLDATLHVYCKAPGRQERINRTTCEAQGGRKGSIGQPARHREAGKNNLDSLQDTREAGKDQLDSIWTAWKTPGREERINLDSK